MNSEGAKTKADGAESVSTAELGASVICSSDVFMRLLMPVTIYWKPQPDITPYELARLLPFVIRYTPIMPYEVPTEPELLRHIEVHDPNV